MRIGDEGQIMKRADCVRLCGVRAVSLCLFLSVRVSASPELAKLTDDALRVLTRPLELANERSLATELQATGLGAFGRVTMVSEDGSVLMELPGSPENVWPGLCRALSGLGWVKQPGMLANPDGKAGLALAMFERRGAQINVSLVPDVRTLCCRVLLQRMRRRGGKRERNMSAAGPAPTQHGGGAGEGEELDTDRDIGGARNRGSAAGESATGRGGAH